MNIAPIRKLIYKVFLLIGMLIYSLHGLSQHSASKEVPAIAKEDPKVYIGSEEKTYVNKALPIYLSFSTTPGGKTHPLKSLKYPQDSEPFYLDTEGANYIRTKWALDPETKEYVYPMREIEMELYADSKPPVVKAITEASKKYKSSDGTWYYGEDLKVSIQESDEQSGVEGSYWSLNGDTWKDGAKVMSEMSSGDYSYSYYARDNVNNYSDIQEVSFVFDKTAPVSDLELTELNDFVFGPKTSVQFKIEEEHAGVKATYYDLDGKGYKTINNGDYIPYSTNDGEYTMSYYSVDNVSNEETPKTKKVYFDKTPPETTLSASPSYDINNLLYVSSLSEISLSASDNKAGVDKTTYSSRDEKGAMYDSPFSLKDYHGYTNVSYSSVDKVANKEKNQLQRIYVDTLKPVSKVSFIGEVFEVSGRYYLNEQTQVKLTGSDANAGLAYLEFTEIGKDFEKYGEPFTLNDEGYFGMMYRAVDNVDNTEYSKSVDLYLDKKGPEIIHRFSNSPIENENGVSVYPVGTRLFLGATDDQSGTNTISYQINGEAEVHYSSPKTTDISERKAFKRGESYKVSIKSTDLVSNETSQTVEFLIEK